MPLVVARSSSSSHRAAPVADVLGAAGRLLVPGAVVVVAYVVLLDYRLDAAGHLAAGHGLALWLAAVLPLRRWSTRVGLAVLAAVWIGLVVERNLFGDVIFDWFDVGNQTVGAALAGCVLLRAVDGDEVSVPIRWVAGAIALATGALLSFGPGFVVGGLR